MMEKWTLPDKIRELMKRGVSIPNPLSLDVGDEVPVDAFSPRGVVLYGGTKIYGSRTVVAEGARLGYEGPVTVENCQIGPSVELRGGYFRESVFLRGAAMGSAAHVREGCILEEESRGGHGVGLKQTILFPFVTLGSLINFCDCLMAGGTGRKNHSEVGSSYIHFNYTPNEDKATPSLIGDVPRGVMINQPPIFLGGQGGIVGPLRIGFGTVVAAGVVCRTDCPEGGVILRDTRTAGKTVAFHPGFYGDVRRRVLNNLFYIGNLVALREWYRHVRKPFLEKGPFGNALFAGALGNLGSALGERIGRLGELAGKMERSIAVARTVGRGGKDRTLLLRQKDEFQRFWPEIRQVLEQAGTDESHVRERDLFLEKFRKVCGESGEFLDGARSLDGESLRLGTLWLQNVVARIVRDAVSWMPSFKIETDAPSTGEA